MSEKPARACRVCRGPIVAPSQGHGWKRSTCPACWRGRPNVRDVGPLAEALYRSTGGSAGCCLHVVLEDTNLDDASVLFCVDWAAKAGHEHCHALAGMLLRMSRTQRQRVSEIAAHAQTGLIKAMGLQRGGDY